jgi:tRNA A37 threonylcarbamoyladenosine biosynthesis protein TsaE
LKEFNFLFSREHRAGEVGDVLQRQLQLGVVALDGDLGVGHTTQMKNVVINSQMVPLDNSREFVEEALVVISFTRALQFVRCLN